LKPFGEIFVIYSMKCSNNFGVMYLAVGAAFMAIGATNPAFMGVGIAFLGLGVSFMVRSKCAVNKLK